jgi:4-hydroxy-tetrahydrodipicolinate synthase
MKLTGDMSALVTPFDANGEIDFRAFERHLSNLRAAGVSGWVPRGSSGEYSFMSDADREEVLSFVKTSPSPARA